MDMSKRLSVLLGNERDERGGLAASGSAWLTVEELFRNRNRP